ncbi:MAG: ATP-dependent protease ATPase subunit HslU [Treponema sp.]|nr:ATP-dependent protease ATPase subunit HslU [Treponema sp.]
MENENLQNYKKIEGLTPKEIVNKLDSYIIGQEKAKKAVAVALRNRIRRIMLSEDIRDEVAPKNILMIGPTGVGKTEIARRLAKLVNAPFVKVEATKYTEVGYVGRDVESMVRDLMAVAFNNVKKEMEESMREDSKPRVEEKLLDLLLPGSEKKTKKNEDEIDIDLSKLEIVPFNGTPEEAQKLMDEQNKKFAEMQAAEEKRIEDEKKSTVSDKTREKFRQMLREGLLEDREVEITVRRQNRMPSMEIITGGSMEDLQSGMMEIQNMLSGRNQKKKTVTIREARKFMTEEVLDSMIDADKVSDIARERVEQSGIIFIDEIDKIATKGGEGHGSNVSREGVQRDILPIVEGSKVSTKFGVVDTTHILFIAAGAFSLASPSDLIPELQGRFPLRVELESLSKDDFKRILLEPKNALTKQYTALLGTEGLKISFTDDAIDRMSTLAEELNSKSENIGARRLHTIMEKVLEEISFDANEHSGEEIKVDSAYVDKMLENVIQDQDLSRYIL